MKSKLLACLVIYISLSLHQRVLSLLLRTEKLDTPKKKEDDISALSDAELEKMMKEYGLDTKDLGILSNLKDENKGKTQDLAMDDDPLKGLLDKDKGKSHASSSVEQLYRNNKDAIRHFNMDKHDAFNLITFISQYQLFNKMPLAAMNIISHVQNQPSFKEMAASSKNKTEETNFMIMNTLNSQVFLDIENKVGRKGLLTFIDKDTSDIQDVWAVLNNKVLCLYSPKNYLKINKIYRISMLKVKDFIYSPCFFVYYDDGSQVNFSNSSALLCALNFNEKEYWMTTLKYHQAQYKK